MTTKNIREFCDVSAQCMQLLRQSVAQLNLSARSFYRIIKVSRTIADLSGEKEITPNHLAEALQYRLKETDIL